VRRDRLFVYAMKVFGVVSVLVAGLVFLVVVLSSPAIGASVRHHHGSRYRGYRQGDASGQEPGSSSSSSSSSHVASVDGDASPWPSNCSHCSARQAKKDYRLASIKNEILRKLHLRAPPNITRRQLPDIPPLRDLIGDEMANDSPPNDYSDDDYHATTMKMMLFPTPGITEILVYNNYFYRLNNNTNVIAGTMYIVPSSVAMPL